jgi:hypothetical protein
MAPEDRPRTKRQKFIYEDTRALRCALRAVAKASGAEAKKAAKKRKR